MNGETSMESSLSQFANLLLWNQAATDLSLDAVLLA